jgi:hypothetical protein
MLRLAELALFLTPFAVFIIWRFFAMEHGPSKSLLIGVACFVALLAGALIWLSEDRAMPPDTDYAPARFENGRIISGHGVPR